MKSEAEVQLESFIAAYSPEIASLARAVLKKLRKIWPASVQLVYDNYNALAIGFATGDKASDAVISIALYPRWINLFFLKGAQLRDPEKLLKGSGKVVRSIRLASSEDLDLKPVRALIDSAIEQAGPVKGPRGLIIKSVSAKQRPRRAN